MEDTETSELKELLESRVKRLHFRPPRVHAAEPWQLMRQHRLFAPLSKDALLEIEKVSDSLVILRSTSAHSKSTIRPMISLHRYKNLKEGVANAPDDVWLWSTLPVLRGRGGD